MPRQDLQISVRLNEPTSSPYLYLDPAGNLQFLIPLVGGVRFATDNTCKTKKEIQTFVETAPRVLRDYATAIEADIVTLERHDLIDGLPAKRARLQQIRHYQVLLDSFFEYLRAHRNGFREGEYGVAYHVLAELVSQTNVRSMQISPRHNPGGIPHAFNTRFRLRDVFVKHFFDSMILDDGMRDQRFIVHANVPNIAEVLQETSLSEEELAQTATPEILATILGNLCERCITELDETEADNFISRLIQRARLAIENNGALSDAEVALRYAYQLYHLDNLTCHEVIHTLCNEMMTCQGEEPQRYFIRKKFANTMFLPEQLQVRDAADRAYHDHTQGNLELLTDKLQFMLGIIGIHLIEYGYVAEDFNLGELLDSSQRYGLMLTEAVSPAFAKDESHRRIEDCVWHFLQAINKRLEDDGQAPFLRRELPLESETWQAICDRFQQAYSALESSTHIDECIMLDTAHDGVAVTHGNRIAVHLGDAARSVGVEVSADVEQMRLAFERHRQAKIAAGERLELENYNAVLVNIPLHTGSDYEASSCLQLLTTPNPEGRLPLEFLTAIDFQLLRFHKFFERGPDGTAASSIKEYLLHAITRQYGQLPERCEAKTAAFLKELAKCDAADEFYLKRLPITTFDGLYGQWLLRTEYTRFYEIVMAGQQASAYQPAEGAYEHVPEAEYLAPVFVEPDAPQEEVAVDDALGQHRQHLQTEFFRLSNLFGKESVNLIFHPETPIGRAVVAFMEIASSKPDNTDAIREYLSLLLKKHHHELAALAAELRLAFVHIQKKLPVQTVRVLFEDLLTKGLVMVGLFLHRTYDLNIEISPQILRQVLKEDSADAALLLAIDLMQRDEEGVPLLEYSAKQGSLIVFQQLIANHPSLIKYKNQRGQTLAELLFQHGQFEKLLFLLQHYRKECSPCELLGQVDVYLQDPERELAPELIKLLLKKGSSRFHSKNKDAYQQITFFAIRHGNLELKELLRNAKRLYRGEDDTEQFIDAILACPNLDVFVYFYRYLTSRHGFPRRPASCTPITILRRSIDLPEQVSDATYEWLLNHFDEIDTDISNSLIHIAIRRDNLPLLRKVLPKVKSVNQETSTALLQFFAERQLSPEPLFDIQHVLYDTKIQYRGKQCDLVSAYALSGNWQYVAMILKHSSRELRFNESILGLILAQNRQYALLDKFLDKFESANIYYAETDDNDETLFHHLLNDKQVPLLIRAIQRVRNRLHYSETNPFTHYWYQRAPVEFTNLLLDKVRRYIFDERDPLICTILLDLLRDYDESNREKIDVLVRKYASQIARHQQHDPEIFRLLTEYNLIETRNVLLLEAPNLLNFAQSQEQDALCQITTNSGQRVFAFTEANQDWATLEAVLPQIWFSSASHQVLDLFVLALQKNRRQIVEQLLARNLIALNVQAEKQGLNLVDLVIDHNPNFLDIENLYKAETSYPRFDRVSNPANIELHSPSGQPLLRAHIQNNMFYYHGNRYSAEPYTFDVTDTESLLYKLDDASRRRLALTIPLLFSDKMGSTPPIVRLAENARFEALAYALHYQNPYRASARNKNPISPIITAIDAQYIAVCHACFRHSQIELAERAVSNLSNTVPIDKLFDLYVAAKNLHASELMEALLKRISASRISAAAMKEFIESYPLRMLFVDHENSDTVLKLLELMMSKFHNAVMLVLQTDGSITLQYKNHSQKLKLISLSSENECYYTVLERYLGSIYHYPSKSYHYAIYSRIPEAHSTLRNEFASRYIDNIIIELINKGNFEALALFLQNHSIKYSKISSHFHKIVTTILEPEKLTLEQQRQVLLLFKENGISLIPQQLFTANETRVTLGAYFIQINRPDLFFALDHEHDQASEEGSFEYYSELVSALLSSQDTSVTGQLIQILRSVFEKRHSKYIVLDNKSCYSNLLHFILLHRDLSLLDLFGDLPHVSSLLAHKTAGDDVLTHLFTLFSQSDTPEEKAFYLAFLEKVSQKDIGFVNTLRCYQYLKLNKDELPERETTALLNKMYSKLTAHKRKFKASCNGSTVHLEQGNARVRLSIDTEIDREVFLLFLERHTIEFTDERHILAAVKACIQHGLIDCLRVMIHKNMLPDTFITNHLSELLFCCTQMNQLDCFEALLPLSKPFLHSPRRKSVFSLGKEKDSYRFTGIEGDEIVLHKYREESYQVESLDIVYNNPDYCTDACESYDDDYGWEEDCSGHHIVVLQTRTRLVPIRRTEKRIAISSDEHDHTTVYRRTNTHALPEELDGKPLLSWLLEHPSAQNWTMLRRFVQFASTTKETILFEESLLPGLLLSAFEQNDSETVLALRSAALLRELDLREIVLREFGCLELTDERADKLLAFCEQAGFDVVITRAPIRPTREGEVVRPLYAEETKRPHVVTLSCQGQQLLQLSTRSSAILDRLHAAKSAANTESDVIGSTAGKDKRYVHHI